MLNYIDFLSPPITLFHLERRTHTSKIGGTLVLIMLVLVLSYISFLLYNLISHNNITSIYHKQFQFQPGNYTFNSTSIYHFIKIFSPDNGGYFGKYDSKYIRIFTTYAKPNYSYIDSNLELYDHWVFDSCQNNKDLDPSLFSNNINLTNAACIKFYYNSTEKIYYDFKDKNFCWPNLENGISQINNIYLTTIVQKCTNTSFSNYILGECSPQKDIDDYLMKFSSIYLFFTDLLVDLANYTYPIQKFLNNINTGINRIHNSIENYIYYSPIKIRTKEGNIFGTTKDINSFYFDFNREETNENNKNYFTIAKYNHLMQNNIEIYERIYKNAFDLISEIGGLIQIIFYIFFWINYIYNKYIVAYDTYSLFFFVQDQRLNKQKGFRNIFFDFKLNATNYKRPKKLSFELNESKKNYINLSHIKKNVNNLNRRNINLGIYSKNNLNLNTDFFLKKNYANTTKDLLFRNIYAINNNNNKNNANADANCSYTKLNDNNNIFNKIKQENREREKENEKVQKAKIISNESINNNKNADNNNSNADNKNNINNNADNNNNNANNKNNSKKNGFLKVSTKSFKSNKSYINNIILSHKSIGKIEHNNIKFRLIMNKENRQSVKKFAFMDSVRSCCFKRNRGSHNFLITFRKHLLSEEHLFKNHIKTVLLEKKYNMNIEENTNILESYNEL